MAHKQGVLTDAAAIIFEAGASGVPGRVRITNEWWYNDHTGDNGVTLYLLEAGEAVGAVAAANKLTDATVTLGATKATFELDIKNLILEPGQKLAALASTTGKITWTIAYEEA